MKKRNAELILSGSGVVVNETEEAAQFSIGTTTVILNIASEVKFIGEDGEKAQAALIKAESGGIMNELGVTELGPGIYLVNSRGFYYGGPLGWKGTISTKNESV